jgi:selenide,water dikinase
MELDSETAIISTADFFPPMIDDPYLFGRIAAANALSDIWAMGGRPILALNLCCFPQSLDKSIISKILQGGAEKIAEAGAVLAGGHSIYDPQTKYGLAVTGLAHPRDIRPNGSARPGEALILTKALGTGLIMSAARAALALADDYQTAISSMERLNGYAFQASRSYPVSASTDVTGFGLLVHLSEMAGADLSITIDFDSLPILPGAARYAQEHLFTAAGQRNRNHMLGKADLRNIPPWAEEILFDPQTSGGLLLSLPASHAQNLAEKLRESEPEAAIIGLVAKREGPLAVQIV